MRGTIQLYGAKDYAEHEERGFSVVFGSVTLGKWAGKTKLQRRDWRVIDGDEILEERERR